MSGRFGHDKRSLDTGTGGSHVGRNSGRSNGRLFQSVVPRARNGWTNMPLVRACTERKIALCKQFSFFSLFLKYIFYYVAVG